MSIGPTLEIKPMGSHSAVKRSTNWANPELRNTMFSFKFFKGQKLSITLYYLALKEF